MKRWMIFAVMLPAIVLTAGCSCPCGPPRQAYVTPTPNGAYVHHSPRRALFTEMQHPLIDRNGQYRIMGDSAYRDWMCPPAAQLRPTPE